MPGLLRRGVWSRRTGGSLLLGVLDGSSQAVFGFLWDHDDETILLLDSCLVCFGLALSGCGEYYYGSQREVINGPLYHDVCSMLFCVEITRERQSAASGR